MILFENGGLAERGECTFTSPSDKIDAPKRSKVDITNDRTENPDDK